MHDDIIVIAAIFNTMTWTCVYCVHVERLAYSFVSRCVCVTSVNNKDINTENKND